MFPLNMSVYQTESTTMQKELSFVMWCNSLILYLGEKQQFVSGAKW